MDIRDLEQLADYNGVGNKKVEEEYSFRYKPSEVEVKKLTKEELEEFLKNA